MLQLLDVLDAGIDDFKLEHKDWLDYFSANVQPMSTSNLSNQTDLTILRDKFNPSVTVKSCPLARARVLEEAKTNLVYFRIAR